MKTLITSSGVIRNRDLPRVGISQANRCADWIFDEIDQGIDLSFEEYCDDIKTEGIEEDSDEWQDRIDDYCMGDCSKTVIFGDAWFKNKQGKFEIDKTKDFAATYNSDSGNISVDWSKRTKLCRNTSPCYVMSNGDGPCGDLDSEGDQVLVYALPIELEGKEEK